MEFWYLAHPLAGDVENNLKKNAALARAIALKYPDRVIFSPIAACSFMDDNIPGHRELGLRYCMAYLRSGLFAGIILPFPEWLYSTGCWMEYREAAKQGIKIEFLNTDTGEVRGV